MSIKTNYFDETSYSASDAVAPWLSLLYEGIFNVENGALIVTAHSPAGLSVDVAAGAGIKNGYYFLSDSTTNVSISANTSGYNRIDILVAEVDIVGKTTVLKVVAGTPSSSPTPPLPTAWQLVIAQIFVGNNVSVINSENIYDIRRNVNIIGNPVKSLDNVNYYVSGTGNDLNNGRTAASPFRTIQRAINMIPDILKHSVTINISAGVYGENVYCDNKIGGIINITGSTSNPEDHSTNRFRFMNCTSDITLSGMKLGYASDNVNTEIINCKSVYLDTNNMYGSGNSSGSGIKSVNSNVKTNNILMSGFYYGVDAENCSTVFSRNWSTNNNISVGLLSQGASTIGKEGTQPTGSAANEQAVTGGVIR